MQIMKDKKNFRIKRTAKFEEVVAKNQLLQNALKKLVGGGEPIKGPVYSRLAGYYEPPILPDL
jgi:hypothetical protein